MEVINKWICEKGFKNKEIAFINDLRRKLGDMATIPIFLQNNEYKEPKWTIPNEEKWSLTTYTVSGNKSFVSWKQWESEEAINSNWLIKVYGIGTNFENIQGYLRLSSNGENSEGIMGIEFIKTLAYPVTNMEKNILYNDLGYLINIGRVLGTRTSIYTMNPEIINTNQANIYGNFTNGFYIGVCNGKWVFGGNEKNFGKVDINNKNYNPRRIIIHLENNSGDGDKTIQLGMTEPEENIKEIFTEWCKTNKIPKFDRN